MWWGGGDGFGGVMVVMVVVVVARVGIVVGVAYVYGQLYSHI